MSTPSRMTIAWDRLDQMALLPQDSSVVIPPPITTIAWTPLLGPTIFDYDPSDFVITPGGGEEVVTTPPSGGGTGTAPEGNEPPPHYGHPHLTVAHRRSVKLFLKDGFYVNVHTTAPAHVRAVLETKVQGLNKKKPHTVNLTKVLSAEVGTEQRKLTLHPSRAGRMSLNKLKGSVSATLEVVVNYGNGQKPIRMRRHVRIIGG
jgi:hypothetical protein